MANLQTQTKNVSAVINFPTDSDYLDMVEIGQKLKRWCSGMCVEWAFIAHFSDTEANKDGEVEFKTPHLHLVFVAGKRARLKSWVLRLSEYLDVSSQCVSVDVVKCLPFAIQYLVHKNDPDKYQYSEREIVTNYSPEELRCYLESDGEYVDERTLIELVRKSSTKADLLLTIGISQYSKYRCVINDLWNSIHWSDFVPDSKKTLPKKEA